MWAFFQELGVIDARGPADRALRRAELGLPAVPAAQGRRAARRGDPRRGAAGDGGACASAASTLAEGHGEQPWDLEPELERRIRRLYDDAKQCIWAELPAAFVAALPDAVTVRTRSSDRTDYILHPPTGERLDARGADARRASCAIAGAGRWDVQIVISDGLNALALTDEGHLAPYLDGCAASLGAAGFRLAPEPIVVDLRARARRLPHRRDALRRARDDAADARARPSCTSSASGPAPGTTPSRSTSPRRRSRCGREPGRVDHNITRVVSGIADTALAAGTRSGGDGEDPERTGAPLSEA